MGVGNVMVLGPVHSELGAAGERIRSCRRTGAIVAGLAGGGRRCWSTAWLGGELVRPSGCRCGCTEHTSDSPSSLSDATGAGAGARAAHLELPVSGSTERRGSAPA